MIGFGLGMFFGVLAGIGAVAALDWYIRSDWPA